MFKGIYFIITLITLSSLSLHSQVLDDSIDVKEKRSKVIFDRYVTYIDQYKKLPSNDVLISTAQFFLGKPYVASTLEQNGDEKLVVNLEEFDCTTFVETCMALTFATVSGDLTFDKFKEYLQYIRYRGGEINGYSSRLHYMTDWIADGEIKKLFKNISKDLGGKRESKQINFMSVHPSLYPKLKNNRSEVDKIAEVESKLLTKEYSFVPRNTILMIGNAVQKGDIIIFATAIGGLDYSHLGLAYIERDVLKMIHASSASLEVVIEKRSIDEYCKAIRNCTGITILRFEDAMSN